MKKPEGKVLVVEDVALIRMTIIDMVEQLGLTAAEAADGPAALAVLKSDDGIAILLTDLGLPGMNGRELVEEALTLKPGLKVIIASGCSTEVEGAETLRGQATFLSKPFDMVQLRRVLGA
ncbi:MAG TPA: response regulator [Rhizomicrobium sp.]|nr:response regulator [Rhizomicrobium sp.]